jgi:hypothetical protein
MTQKIKMAATPSAMISKRPRMDYALTLGAEAMIAAAKSSERRESVRAT